VTSVHLVRHGEVENPMGVIYGRLPGYNLSERGERQAKAAAERLKDADVGAIWSSPLERAQETAALIAEPHGLDIVTDMRITETDTTLEGLTRSIAALFRSPRRWWHFRNPIKPSWGESFSDVRARMLDAIADARDQAGGRDVVLVSHQTPVLVARLALTQRRLPPWLPFTPCETGSVTTLTVDDGVVSASYFRPPPDA
jgi:broad specificity phosphatase PhoE